MKSWRYPFEIERPRDDGAFALTHQKIVDGNGQRHKLASPMRLLQRGSKDKEKEEEEEG
jgi:hypothetical protein